MIYVIKLTANVFCTIEPPENDDDDRRAAVEELLARCKLTLAIGAVEVHDVTPRSSANRT